MYARTAVYASFRPTTPACGLGAVLLALLVSPSLSQPTTPEPETLSIVSEARPLSELLPQVGEALRKALDSPPPEVSPACATLLLREAPWSDVRHALEIALCCKWQGETRLGQSEADLQWAEKACISRQGLILDLLARCASAAEIGSPVVPKLRKGSEGMEAIASHRPEALAALGLSEEEVNWVCDNAGLAVAMVPPGGIPCMRFLGLLPRELLEMVASLGRVRRQAWALSEEQRTAATEALCQAARKEDTLAYVDLWVTAPYGSVPLPAYGPAGCLLVRLVGATGFETFSVFPLLVEERAGAYQSPPPDWQAGTPPSWEAPPPQDAELDKPVPRHDGLDTVASWPLALKLLHEKLGLNVVSDAFAEEPVAPLPLRKLQWQSLRALLDSLGTRFGYRWTKTGAIYGFQSAFWFEARSFLLAPGVVEGLTHPMTEEGSVSWPYLLSLASFRSTQRDQLDRALWPIFEPNAPWTPVLYLLKSLTSEQVSIARGNDGLPCEGLSEEQLKWLQTALEARAVQKPPSPDKGTLVVRVEKGQVAVYMTFPDLGPVCLDRYRYLRPEKKEQTKE